MSYRLNLVIDRRTFLERKISLLIAYRKFDATRLPFFIYPLLGLIIPSFKEFHEQRLFLKERLMDYGCTDLDFYDLDFAICLAEGQLGLLQLDALLDSRFVI
jgi:hypothetical protein